jgi:DNA-binding NtrC family response regulator
MSGTGVDPGHVLVVDDEPEMLENCRRLLSREGHHCTLLDRPEEFHHVLREARPDVVLMDVRMPGVDGMELLAAARAEDPDLPIILITGYATVSDAVEAIQEGAFDYLTKPFRAPELTAAIVRALRQRRLTAENRVLRERVNRQIGLEDILGASPAIARLKEQIHKVAPIDVSVLISGESGTGKELVARSLHAGSPRSSGPFVAVDCAAIPDTLLESALFGHEKGAFTGADRQRCGLLEEANGGTLFFDEITTLGAHLQARLLRALQEREIRRVGGQKMIPLDVRVIAATNIDPVGAVADGRFREDLYYRFNVIPIELSPLRKREGDVALLFQAFVERFAGQHAKPVPRITRSVWKALERYEWPGNVRELKNLAERLVILDDDMAIVSGDLPGAVRGALPIVDADGSDTLGLPWPKARRRAIQTFEERYVERLLEEHGGSVTRAAEAAGVSRRTLHRWLQRSRQEEE